jgi:hypothetical protein
METQPQAAAMVICIERREREDAAKSSIHAGKKKKTRIGS